MVGPFFRKKESVKKETEGYEKYQVWATRLAATLLLLGFLLLLAALILACRGESGGIEEHAEKAWVEARRMSERTQSSPLLRTDDESDANIAIRAEDEEVEERMIEGYIMITNEEESDKKMRGDEKDGDVRKTEEEHKSAALMSVTHNVANINDTRDINTQIDETAGRYLTTERKQELDIQASKQPDVTRHERYIGAKQKSTLVSPHESRGKRGASTARIKMTTESERPERCTESGNPRKIQLKIRESVTEDQYSDHYKANKSQQRTNIETTEQLRISGKEKYHQKGEKREGEDEKRTHEQDGQEVEPRVPNGKMKRKRRVVKEYVRQRFFTTKLEEGYGRPRNVYDCDNSEIFESSMIEKCIEDRDYCYYFIHDQPVEKCGETMQKVPDQTRTHKGIYEWWKNGKWVKYDRKACKIWRITETYLQMLYAEVMNYGLAYDHISNFKGLGLVHLLIDGKFHMMRCEKVNVTYLEKDEKCFSEGVLRAKRNDNNQTILVTRAGFITKFANEISCDRDKKTEERARTKLGQRQTILLSSEILALYIFHNIASPLVFSRLFGLKTVTELLLKQGEWITGYSRRSVITLLHVFWRSLSPWLIFAYTTIKIGWGFVIFTIGLKFKLGAQTLTFLLTPIKQAMELRKLLIERNLASSQMISRDYLNRTGQRLGIANITHAHLSSLYENACMANSRIELLERRLDGGSSYDCVITFSSDESNENTGNNTELKTNRRATQENTGKNAEHKTNIKKITLNLKNNTNICNKVLSKKNKKNIKKKN